MGCCGCDNRTSVNTGGIFAIIQSIVGIVLAIYNLNIFYGDCFSNASDKGYLCYVLWSSIATIRVMLILVIIFYALWIISSFFLFVGNSSNRPGYIRQWVIISTIVIICDIIFPSVVVGTTYSTIVDQYQVLSSRSSYFYQPASDRNLIQNYFVLLLTFSRGGIITWCSTIALTVYASRRMREILNPPATYVYTQAFPVGGPGIVNPLQNPMSYPQGAYPPQGYGNPNPLAYQQPVHYSAPGQANKPYEFSSPPPSYTSLKSPQ